MSLDTAGAVIQTVSGFASLAVVMLTVTPVREMASQRMEANKPVVLVNHGGPETYSNLGFRLRNIGTGPAFDVTVKVEHSQLPYKSERLEMLERTEGDAAEYVKVWLAWFPPADDDPEFLIRETEFPEIEPRGVLSVIYRGVYNRHWETRQQLSLTVDRSSDSLFKLVKATGEILTTGTWRWLAWVPGHFIDEPAVVVAVLAAIVTKV